MANFKDYMAGKNNQKSNSNMKRVVDSASSDQKAQAKNIYEQNKGRSESDMMREIETRIKEQKKNGGFSEKEINAFIGQIAPMLGEQERRKLMSIVSKMKD